ncbi:acyltransferase domain-containing protein [Amycolatopsis samaneae]|uniref:Acyltransferase domain-containing protein n=1 Tax=Amycolatopsis samaneae TaxID=664691 RepID=A0ABW5GST1_9PSEU
MSGVALLLPGQGAQHPGMATALYRTEPVFTAVLDEFFAELGAEGDRLRADWLGPRPVVPLDDASRAQPLLFAIGYAMGRTVLARGLEVTALLGHSVGELAAAALAGVFDLPAAAGIMRARTAALAGVPPGGLLAVAAAPERLTRWLGGPDPVLGAVNAPGQTVLAGTGPALDAVEKSLLDNGIGCRRIGARQPFHSPAVADAAAEFEAGFATVRLRPPRIPVWSASTGEPVRPDQAVSPGFWARQLAGPVWFHRALDGLLGTRPGALVETGPGRSLSMLARRHPVVRRRRIPVLPLLPAATATAATAARWHEAKHRLTDFLSNGEKGKATS